MTFDICRGNRMARVASSVEQDCWEEEEMKADGLMGQSDQIGVNKAFIVPRCY